MGAPVLVAGCALLVSAGGLFCFMPLRGAGAGECARRRSNFLLLRQKKVTKEKATPSLRPLRGAKGQTCVRAVAGCAAELTARLGRFVQTAAASQMTKPGRTCAQATPPPSRRRRSHRGWTAEQPLGPLLRSALAGQRAVSVAWAFSIHIVRFATKSFWLKEQLSSENSALDSSRSSRFSSTSL